MKKFKLCVVVPTYKREKLLIEAVNSIKASAESCQNAEVTLCIFDNDNKSNNDEVIKKIKSDSLNIYYQKRESNIGGNENIIQSLIDSKMNTNCDAFVYLSDDDFVLPRFIEKITSEFIKGVDALMSSCYVMHEPSLGSNEYTLARHTSRNVPTRGLSNHKERLQFILDSRLLSGIGYSRSLVDRFTNQGDAIKEYAMGLWYPMSFLSSFVGDNVAFIRDPLFVHTQDNQIFWNEFDPYNDFFLGRIEMYETMERIGNLNRKEKETLLTDFIGHQPLLRIIRYISTKNRTKLNFLKIIYVIIYRKLILERIPKFFEASFRRMLFILGKYRYL